MNNIIKVGMADYKTCLSPDGLTTLGLGSCVGVAVRDPIKKIGGLAHVMLPDSTIFRTGNVNVAKFADTAIPALVEEMKKLGANTGNLTAKIAGGATMFAFQNKSELVRVGDHNVEAAKKALEKLKIRIIAEDTGDSYGRTVIFLPETGDYIIRAVGKEEKII